MNEMNTQQKMNAVEAWPIYDTVLIGPGFGNVNGAKWYNTFAELAASDEGIPFFNQRNRSGVGVAYTNMDAKESMPFGYEVFSLGVEFSAPAAKACEAYSYDGDTLTGPTVDLHDEAHAIFAGELQKHCSVRLQVAQDEKLVAAAQLCPAGVGVSGFASINGTDALNGVELGGVQAYSNGLPVIQNRFKFPEPVQIPRNHVVSVHVQLSTYAKRLLEQLAGPGRVLTGLAPGATWVLNDATVPAACMLRVSLFGRRHVQQRNELHY
jgi:hypothetical protein